MSGVSVCFVFVWKSFYKTYEVIKKARKYYAFYYFQVHKVKRSTDKRSNSAFNVRLNYQMFSCIMGWLSLLKTRTIILQKVFNVPFLMWPKESTSCQSMTDSFHVTLGAEEGDTFLEELAVILFLFS